MRVETVPAQGRQHEGGAVAVLPEDHPPDGLTPHVGGVVLGPDEAVLYQAVGERVDPVTVCPPGEDLRPADQSGPVSVVAARQDDGVEGGVGQGDSLYLRVGRLYIINDQY